MIAADERQDEDASGGRAPAGVGHRPQQVALSGSAERP